jgi:hypothetical protein
MRIEQALQNVRRIFIDTAPVIYYVERNPAYISRVDMVFERRRSVARRDIACHIGRMPGCADAPCG